MDVINKAKLFLYRVLIGTVIIASVAAAIVTLFGIVWALLTYAAGLVITALVVAFVYTVGDFFLYART